MKPRKYLGRRSKPDGGGGAASVGPEVNSYYHFKKRNLSYLKSKRYSEGYKNLLQSQLELARKKDNRMIIISVLIGLVIILLLFVYFNSHINLF